jgi:hypothetical protein
MTPSSLRFLPLGRWQYLRWVLVLALPLAFGACTSQSSSALQAPDAGIGPLQTPDAGTSKMTSFSILVSPERAIDILFMVDNSPSMDPKQTALATSFSQMISVLETLPGGLPDLHIGVASSSMGAGNGAMGGACGSGIGDMGLLWGNDPNNMIASVADGTPYATDPNHPLIASGCGLYPGQRWIEDIQLPAPGTGRQRNYDATNLPLQDVFFCLATAVGVRGCGQEHQLQATRVALIPQTFNQENTGFVRPNAYLAIVLVTDEDDCSATNINEQNDDMFNMYTKRDPNDTTSLRCAARGHLCGGQPIPDFDHVAGYTGTAPFTHAFSDCSAKSQLTAPDYVYMPLIDVQAMVDSVKSVKEDMWPQRILVSGIIGWPPDPNDTSLPSTVQVSDQYRIDRDATSLPPGQQNLWDYMPICWDPAQKSADGNIYKAYGGLRLKQFIDAFGTHGQTFSICNSNFANAMQQIGNAIVQLLKPGCVQYPLIDTDPNTPYITEPECQVVQKIPCTNIGQNGCLQDGYIETSLPECKDGQGNILDPFTLDSSAYTQDQVNAVLANVSDGSRPCWYLSYDPSAMGCADVFRGQRISTLLPTGTLATPGTILAMQCLTCAAADGICPPEHH